MTDGQSQSLVTVVPESGTDELAGLTGTMTIIVGDGMHFYELGHTLAETL